jgi:uncharacterized protein YcnI
VIRTIRRPLVLGAALAAAAVLALSTPASAHIDPDLGAVPAGKAVTVAFKVEHGCEESPTTKLEFKVPDGVTDAKGVAKEGWTTATAGGVVTFAEGSQPPHEETTFSISFTAPDAVGTELRFPVIQTCAEGSISWISTSESDDHPAPLVKVGPADATATTEAPDEGGGDETTTTAAGSSSTTVASGGTTTAPAPDTTTTVAPAGSGSTSKSNDSKAPYIVTGVVIVVLAVGAYALIRSRSKSQDVG